MKPSTIPIGFFVSYLLNIVILPIIEAYNGETIYGWHLAVVIIGILVVIPTLISFILGIISIKKFNKYNKQKKLIRKILNILNVVADTNKKLSELAKQMTSYPQVVVNAKVTNERKKSYNEDKKVIQNKSK